MKQVVLAIHNVRSAHNVGSMLRTADGLGMVEVLMSGYSPYPRLDEDERLPHIANRITKQIHKTSLGAENSVKWRRAGDLAADLNILKADGFLVAALEQTPDAKNIADFKAPKKIVLIVGNEIEGLDENLLKLCDVRLQILMRGKKESFNVAVAAAMAMYQLTSLDK